MPFDPTLPQTNSPESSAEMRAQFIGSKTPSTLRTLARGGFQYVQQPKTRNRCDSVRRLCVLAGGLMSSFRARAPKGKNNARRMDEIDSAMQRYNNDAPTACSAAPPPHRRRPDPIHATA